MRSFLLKFNFWLLVLCAALTAKSQPSARTLQDADLLFNQYKLADSRAIYAGIAADVSIDAATRVKACQKLAEQDWKFYNDFAGATKALQTARALKVDLTGTALLTATINLENKNYKEALDNAKESLRLALSKQDRAKAIIVSARVVHDWGFYEVRHNQMPDKTELKETVRWLGEVLNEQPGNPDASETLIGIGLLLKDGNTILKGWKSYYLVSDESKINGALSTGFRELKSVLQNWTGAPLTTTKMQTLALGFADSKLFNYANYVAQQIAKNTPVVFSRSKPLHDIVAYQAYIDDVKHVNDGIYPEVARGRQKYDDAYDSLMNIAGKVLWNKLSFIPKSEKFDPDTLYNILNRKYGEEGYSGTTVNYYGMLMGHIIHKELKQISQYGYTTKFTYISIDRLISRDFTSWYGTTNVGGWGDSTTIIQVRKAYMTEPFQLLNLVTDSTARKTAMADIAQKREADLEICKEDPYTEPKFLSPYLKLSEASKIYRRLKESGLKGMELNIGFIDEILKLTVASTVFAHEGRHAIDQLYFPKEFKTMSDDERELRAKYSEVAFSLDPKMAFTGSILGSGLDINTNHGKANYRFRKIIVDWMMAHQPEIRGLDKNIPMLIQFDLLTDAQLIAICQSADPFAKAQRN